MSEVLVFDKFQLITLSYIDRESDQVNPDEKAIVIVNDGTIDIYESESGSKGLAQKEKLKVDVYDIMLLYKNLKDIIDSDKYDKETLRPSGITFSIYYSKTHSETCSPLLSNDKGISILSVIEGFLAYARKEHTYYNWYSVALNSFEKKGYSYYYDDDSIKIGDNVMVPVGEENHEMMGTVVNFWRLPEEKLPLPIEKMKKIIRKVVHESTFSIDHFLETVEYTDKTPFEFTNVDGYKVCGNIYGDYRDDDTNMPEPYLKCILYGGHKEIMMEHRIAEIRKLD